ncbi:hypothetical protein [Solibacillus sp. CAU 1738]|uniref:hypothetical protein n=1 Tax=Solibacillus sp. CAU 1738 TaxID=3140363 RepID=UPI0032608B3F
MLKEFIENYDVQLSYSSDPDARVGQNQRIQPILIKKRNVPFLQLGIWRIRQACTEKKNQATNQVMTFHFDIEKIKQVQCEKIVVKSVQKVRPILRQLN